VTARARHTVLALVVLSCRGEAPAPPTEPGATPSAVPVDRLAPGELRPGAVSLYGLVLPEGMQIIARHPSSQHAAGDLTPEHVATYVRERIVVSRVELGPARTIFPQAKIRGADPQRTYQIDVVAAGKQRTVLEVQDVTPPRKTEGLSDAQRLDQVGLRPDGKLKDPARLE
jgi:hypothetical protein